MLDFEVKFIVVYILTFEQTCSKAYIIFFYVYEGKEQTGYITIFWVTRCFSFPAWYFTCNISLLLSTSLKPHRPHCNDSSEKLQLSERKINHNYLGSCDNGRKEWRQPGCKRPCVMIQSLSTSSLCWF